MAKLETEVDIAAFVKALQDYGGEMLTNTEAALDEFCSHVLTQSEIICPIKTGDLRATGNLSKPITENGVVSQTISYGSDYALYVHERLDLAHKPPTSAKFLEISLRANEPNFEKFLVERLG